jgi:hypothetical protein
VGFGCSFYYECATLSLSLSLSHPFLACQRLSPLPALLQECSRSFCRSVLGNTMYAAAIMMFGADFLWAIVIFVCFFLFPMSSHQVSSACVCQDGLCSESRNLSTWPYDHEHQEMQCFGMRWRRSRDDENFELCKVKEGRKERGNKRSRCCCCWRKRSRTGSRNKPARTL